MFHEGSDFGLVEAARVRVLEAEYLAFWCGRCPSTMFVRGSLLNPMGRRRGSTSGVLESPLNRHSVVPGGPDH